MLTILKIINFKEYYPGYDCIELFPELNINEEGFAQIDENELLEGFDYDIDHYSEDDKTLIYYFFLLLKLIQILIYMIY